MRKLGVALIHFPVLDKSGGEVTSAVTNLDIHDIARSAFSYGVEAYYIVHPIDAQRTLVERIRNHWVDGSGARRIPDRSAPLAQVRTVPSLRDAMADFGAKSVEVWTTSARSGSSATSYAEARALLRQSGPPVLLCLGTSWGLSGSVHELATVQLAPIESPRADGYNHLSVRAAAAIIFDRLLSIGAG